MGRALKENKTSKYIGVCKIKHRNTYRAFMLIEGKIKIIGEYKEERTAALVYDKFAIKHNRPTNILKRIII